MRRVIATMTLARDAAEGTRIVESMRALAAHGMPIVVADGGSGRDVVDELERIDGVRLVRPDGSGLVRQILTSLAAVRDSGADRVLYTEPDKLEFFVHGLPHFLASAARDRSALTIAARSEAAFATFPPMQRATERALNGIVSELTGVDGDYCYGPFDANARLVDMVTGVDPALGWGWRIALFVRAASAGHPIHVEFGDHECPADQRSEARPDRSYRLRQLSQNVQGALEGLAIETGVSAAITR